MKLSGCNYHEPVTDYKYLFRSRRVLELFFSQWNLKEVVFVNNKPSELRQYIKTTITWILCLPVIVILKSETRRTNSLSAILPFTLIPSECVWKNK